ncbi:MAG TPA: NifU family protein [Bacteroidia bacterium]|jgi:Fe-S cluster biogenesis protein NfuA|nr:NifU family protein [Bacteroidia bacterium]
MDAPEIPFMVYAEATPNPASMKFVANKMLLPQGATAQYSTIAETKGAPLAQKLFEFPFVRQVFISGNYVTITKADFISWDDVLLETRSFITEYLNKKNPVITEIPSTEVAVDNSFSQTKNVFTEHASPKNEVEAKIIETLEQYIRPAVEQDGGMIVFKELNEGVVTVKMKGACSGCPSSTMTLKAGIEGLLKRLLPDDVKEVVSEAV